MFVQHPLTITVCTHWNPLSALFGTNTLYIFICWIKKGVIERADEQYFQMSTWHSVFFIKPSLKTTNLMKICAPESQTVKDYNTCQKKLKCLFLNFIIIVNIIANTRRNEEREENLARFICALKFSKNFILIYATLRRWAVIRYLSSTPYPPFLLDIHCKQVLLECQRVYLKGLSTRN